MSAVVLHGGGAAEVNDWYEEEWTFFSLLDLLAGLATAIHLGAEGACGRARNVESDDRAARRHLSPASTPAPIQGVTQPLPMHAALHLLVAGPHTPRRGSVTVTGTLDGRSGSETVHFEIVK